MLKNKKIYVIILLIFIVLFIIFNFNKIIMSLELIIIFALLLYSQKNSIKNEFKNKNSNNIKVITVKTLNQKNENDIKVKDDKINLDFQESKIITKQEIKDSNSKKENSNNSNISNKQSMIKNEIIPKNEKKISHNKIDDKVLNKEQMPLIETKNKKVNNNTNIGNIENLKVYKNIEKIKKENLIINNKMQNKQKESDYHQHKPILSNEEKVFCALVSKIIYDNNNKVNKIYYNKNKNGIINLESTNINFGIKNKKKYFILPQREKNTNQKKEEKENKKIIFPINNSESLNKISKFIINESKKIKKRKIEQLDTRNIFTREKTLNIIAKKKKKERNIKLKLLINGYLKLANYYHKSKEYDKEIKILKRGLNKFKDKNVDINIFLRKIEIAQKELEDKVKTESKKKILLKEQK